MKVPRIFHLQATRLALSIAVAGLSEERAGVSYLRITEFHNVI